MRCIECENPNILKSKKITLKYKDCGLDNVTLHGVECFKCNKCGEEYLSYGDQEKLHTLIAEVLIRKKENLTGEEIRFLRTYLGYSGIYFARLTGYTQETISRFENNKKEVVLSFDRLVRSLVANKLPDRNYDLHEMWLNEKGTTFKRIEVNARKDGWHLLKQVA